MDGLTVGQVAQLAGTTVRTLHHYDDIGLVVPSMRERGGYRRYSDTDIHRLMRVLAYRAMDIDLAGIAELLGDTSQPPDAAETLERLGGHLELLRARIDSLHRIEEMMEKTMKHQQAGITLTPAEMLEVFGERDPSEFANEAAQQWGASAQWQESRRRTRSYSKDDWLRCQREGAAAAGQLLAAFRGEQLTSSPDARAGAHAHRAHLDKWFYPCSAEMHCALADMYIADPRFTAHYDELAPGFAQYVHDAIWAASVDD